MPLPDSVAAVPGIRGVPAEGLNMLARISAAHGWNIDGLAAAIAHESGWNPAAVNPSYGATGLIQFLPRTLATYGTNPSAVAKMSVAQQLPLVERFFSNWERWGYVIGPADFLAFGLGVGEHAPRGRLIPDETVLYEADSAGAKANTALADADGAIRMGRMRQILTNMLTSAAKLPRVEIPESVPPKVRLARLIRAP